MGVKYVGYHDWWIVVYLWNVHAMWNDIVYLWW